MRYVHLVERRIDSRSVTVAIHDAASKIRLLGGGRLDKSCRQLDGSRGQLDGACRQWIHGSVVAQGRVRKWIARGIYIGPWSVARATLSHALGGERKRVSRLLFDNMQLCEIEVKEFSVRRQTLKKWGVTGQSEILGRCDLAAVRERVNIVKSHIFNYLHN